MERELIEKLWNSYIGITRGEDVYVGKVVKDERFHGNLALDVKTKRNSGVVYYSKHAIHEKEEVVLGKDLFKEFGGLKQFRYALVVTPFSRRRFRRYKEDDLRAMYREDINKIVDGLTETEMELERIQKATSKIPTQIEIS